MINTQKLLGQIKEGIESSSRPEKLMYCATIDINNEDLATFLSTLPRHSPLRHIIERAIARNDYKEQLISSIHKRNHDVRELLMWYNNKKSGKVVLARKELQQRFLYLSYDEQLEIMRTFLRGKKTDLAWCYKILRKWWSDELLSQVIDLWDASHDECCGWLITRYATIDQLRERADYLSYRSNYSSLCKRLASEPWFVIDKEKLWNALDVDSDVMYLWIMSQTQEGLSNAEAWSIIYHRIAKTIIAAEKEADSSIRFLFDGPSILVNLKTYNTPESIFYITCLAGMDKMLCSLIQMGLYQKVYDFIEWDEMIHRQFVSEYSEIDSMKDASYGVDEHILDYYKEYVKIVAKHFPIEYYNLLEAERNNQEKRSHLMFQDSIGRLQACPKDEDFTNETGYDLRGLSEEQKDVYYKDYIKKHSTVNPQEEINEQKQQNWNRIVEENASLTALTESFGLTPVESNPLPMVPKEDESKTLPKYPNCMNSLHSQECKEAPF